MIRFFRWFGLPGRLVMTILLDLVALLFALIFFTPIRWICFFAMLLSSLGDIILMNYKPIVSHLPFRGFLAGGTAFGVSHIVYALAFLTHIWGNGKTLLNAGFAVGIALFVLSTLVLTLCAFLKQDAKKGDLGQWYLYFFFLYLDAAFVLSAAVSFGGIFWISAIGIFSFCISDLLIAFPRCLNFRLENADDLIWTFYPIGQLLLLIGA